MNRWLGRVLASAALALGAMCATIPEAQAQIYVSTPPVRPVRVVVRPPRVHVRTPRVIVGPPVVVQGRIHRNPYRHHGRHVHVAPPVRYLPPPRVTYVQPPPVVATPAPTFVQPAQPYRGAHRH